MEFIELRQIDEDEKEVKVAIRKEFVFQIIEAGEGRVVSVLVNGVATLMPVFDEYDDLLKRMEA